MGQKKSALQLLFTHFNKEISLSIMGPQCKGDMDELERVQQE